MKDYMDLLFYVSTLFYLTAIIFLIRDVWLHAFNIDIIKFSLVVFVPLTLLYVATLFTMGATYWYT